MQNVSMIENGDLECAEVGVANCGIFAPSKHSGARETAVTSERL
jgi:hypothetical protein